MNEQNDYETLAKQTEKTPDEKLTRQTYDSSFNPCFWRDFRRKGGLMTNATQNCANETKPVERNKSDHETLAKQAQTKPA